MKSLEEAIAYGRHGELLNLDDVIEANRFLRGHPIFRDRNNRSKFPDPCLIVYSDKVNPETKEIDPDFSKNTEAKVYLECGRYTYEYERLVGDGVVVYDKRLSCSAPTFREAIVKLAKLVEHYFGHDDKFFSCG